MYRMDLHKPKNPIKIGEHLKRLSSSLNLSNILMAFAALALGACSSGGGSSKGTSSSSSSSANVTAPQWIQGQFLPEFNYYQYCTNVRSGTDPGTGTPYIDEPGTAMHEKMWQRSITNEYYLWYDQVPDRNPAPYSILDYFDTLQAPQDRFHYTQSYEEFLDYYQGESVGYGFDYTYQLKSADEYGLYVSFVEEASPYKNLLQRGDEILAIDGQRFDQIFFGTATEAQYTNFFNALSPSTNGERHNFELKPKNADTSSFVDMTAQKVNADPVPIAKTFQHEGDTLAYLLFNSHNYSSEAPLITAFENFVNEGASDLILDLRYNTGGLLDVASEVAYMIAGPGRTQGKVFEQLQFNDKYANTNPFSGEVIQPDYFLDESQGFDNQAAGEALPYLGLDRVFVLTSDQTCSASESIINGLRGVDVEVIQIGDTTCGKTTGFYPLENCGTVYFTVMFQGVNDKGFGDYNDGFSPQGSNTSNSGSSLPGCTIDDDLSQALGDTSEDLLEVALSYRSNQSCPVAMAPTASESKPSLQTVKSAIERALPKQQAPQPRSPQLGPIVPLFAPYR